MQISIPSLIACRHLLFPQPLEITWPFLSHCTSLHTTSNQINCIAVRVHPDSHLLLCCIRAASPPPPSPYPPSPPGPPPRKSFQLLAAIRGMPDLFQATKQALATSSALSIYTALFTSHQFQDNTQLHTYILVLTCRCSAVSVQQAHPHPVHTLQAPPALPHVSYFCC